MKNYFAVAALSAAVFATPAHAQDPDQISKINIGAIVGIDSVELDVTGLGSDSDEGVAYGITAGYDHGFGDIFIGIEGEIVESEVGVTARDVLAAGDRVELDASRDLYVGARLGAYVGDVLSLYVKGGYTNAGIEGEYFDGTTTFEESDNLGGYRLGGGLEAQLTSSLALRAEYRYSDYGEYSYAGVASGVSATRQQGVVGLIGRF